MGCPFKEKCIGEKNYPKCNCSLKDKLPEGYRDQSDRLSRVVLLYQEKKGVN